MMMVIFMLMPQNCNLIIFIIFWYENIHFSLSLLLTNMSVLNDPKKIHQAELRKNNDLTSLKVQGSGGFGL